MPNCSNNGHFATALPMLRRGLSPGWRGYVKKQVR
jgi:hypothetical protein